MLTRKKSVLLGLVLLITILIFGSGLPKTHADGHTQDTPPLILLETHNLSEILTANVEVRIEQGEFTSENTDILTSFALSPILSPDGSNIVWVNPFGNGLCIYFVESDRTICHVDEGLEGANTSIVWSPDGRYFAQAQGTAAVRQNFDSDLIVYDI